MLNKLMNLISAENKGFLALALGLVLILGALGKLGFFQTSLNIITIVVGVYLIFQGLQASKLLNRFKK